jgi:hypothetical protein
MLPSAHKHYRLKESSLSSANPKHFGQWGLNFMAQFNFTCVYPQVFMRRCELWVQTCNVNTTTNIIMQTINHSTAEDKPGQFWPCLKCTDMLFECDVGCGSVLTLLCSFPLELL